MIHRETLTPPVTWIRAQGRTASMGTIIIVLLVLWLVFGVLGFVIKGLIWLGIIGIVLFIGTAVWGAMKRRT